ncbi:hypothetical protein EAX61_01225 [Dokdonia sinensis]|uniref:Uncharacterized protein n=1 Tax=Dokdonia sinensis TaxID=2479847 RepID=A0A3M0GG09_9FLAO|nr:hypothetical protein EAX61_01225 [Dokdonia sinensis]
MGHYKVRRWVLGFGYKIMGKCLVLEVGCWVLGVGSWKMGAGCWVLGVGCWVLGFGFCLILFFQQMIVLANISDI